jgi:hypothetical protein
MGLHLSSSFNGISKRKQYYQAHNGMFVKSVFFSGFEPLVQHKLLQVSNAFMYNVVLTTICSSGVFQGL